MADDHTKREKVQIDKRISRLLGFHSTMPTGEQIQQTKAIGEYLVCAELGRRGFIATPFAGNVPEFDIVAIRQKAVAKLVQVKTIRTGDWQFLADRFLSMSVKNGRQSILGKLSLSRPETVYVFVKLSDLDSGFKDRFFVLTLRKLQNKIDRKYGDALAKIKGRRPRNPNSFHCAVSVADLEEYEDNWKLLLK